MSEEAKSADPAVVEIYLAVNEDGDIGIGTDADEAAERLNEDYGGHHCRVICMSIDIAGVIPAEIAVEAALPQKEDGTFELAIKS